MKREGRMPVKGEDVCSACEVQEQCDQHVDQIVGCAHGVIEQLSGRSPKYTVMVNATSGGKTKKLKVGTASVLHDGTIGLYFYAFPTSAACELIPEEDQDA